LFPEQRHFWAQLKTLFNSFWMLMYWLFAFFKVIIYPTAESIVDISIFEALHHSTWVTSAPSSLIIKVRWNHPNDSKFIRKDARKGAFYLEHCIRVDLLYAMRTIVSKYFRNISGNLVHLCVE
jgi:hypothetical protein